MVISKPGGPNETRRAFAVSLRAKGVESRAMRRQWGTRFPIWRLVNGRKSVTSVVGLVEEALLVSILSVLVLVCKEYFRMTHETNFRINEGAQMAFTKIYCGNDTGAKSLIVLRFSDGLEVFSRYLRQLTQSPLRGLHLLRQHSKQLLNSGPISNGLKVPDIADFTFTTR